MQKNVLLIMTLGFLIGPWGNLWASTGQSSFQQKCSACHTIGDGARVGPDLGGVTQRRDEAWLIRWIMEPDKMLAEKDPIALELLQQSNQVPMPNLSVSEEEARDLIEYMAAESAAKKAVSAAETQQAGTNPSPSPGGIGGAQLAALLVFLGLAIIIILVFWQIAKSTRQPVPTIDMKSAYRLRKKFFFGSSVIVLGTLAATLPRTPYFDDLQTPDQLIYVTAKQFGFIFTSEPVTSESDLERVKVISSVELPVGALVEFRVTSLDVNHGFGLYGPNLSIIAQTQAMPGYTNRLRVRFEEPGVFNVLCLEYCGLAHHLMRATLIVR